MYQGKFASCDHNIGEEQEVKITNSLSEMIRKLQIYQKLYVFLTNGCQFRTDKILSIGDLGIKHPKIRGFFLKINLTQKTFPSLLLQLLDEIRILQEE